METMQLRAILLLSAAVISLAYPVYGQHASYAPASRYGGGATVTSYHRRGSYATAGDLHKPTIYGSSYGAPRSHAPYPAPAPVAHRSPTHGAYQAPSPAQGGLYQAPSPALGASYQAVGPAHQQYEPSPRSYGPQRNAFSEYSQKASHDPHYDSAKDPVSQYAQYVPVFEYAPKASGPGNELSIYGYRK